MGRLGFVVGVIGVIGMVVFIFVFKLMLIVNVVLFYVVVFMIVVLLVWIWMGECMSCCIFLSVLVVLGGVMVIVLGLFGVVYLCGDIFVLIMIIVMVVVMVIYCKFFKILVGGLFVL